MRSTALFFVLSSSLLAVLSSAAAQTPPADSPPPPQAVAAPVADPDEIICRVTAIVGSRLQSRLCLPRRRWDQMHRDGVDFIRRIQDSSEGGQMRH